MSTLKIQKIVYWSSVVAVLGFLAYRELQVDTLGFSLEPIYIPAKRSDVFRMLVDEPEFWLKVHPLCTGVGNIVRSQDEHGKRIMKFDMHQNLELFGFKIYTGTLHITTRVIEEDASTLVTANPLRGMVKINQGFHLADAENGREGTMLGDHAEYTAPRILARFVLRKATAAHIVITQNIRQHFVEISQQIRGDI